MTCTAASFLVVALAVGAAQAAGQTPETSPSAATYDSLEARLLAGDTAVDYRALRMAYTATEEYDPMAAPHDPWRKRMKQAQDAVEARAAADSLLLTNYPDIEAHMTAAGASAALGDSARLAFHRSVARGLIASIARPGLGTNPDAPFEVIAIPEEYALLRAFGLQRESQALGECAGQPCDWLTVVDTRTGRKQTLYFDVSRVRAWFDRQ